jgi:hypothetical protein
VNTDPREFSENVDSRFRVDIKTEGDKLIRQISKLTDESLNMLDK